jgi:hypothetical protein
MNSPKWALPALRLLAAMPDLDLPKALFDDTIDSTFWFPPGDPASLNPPGGVRMAVNRAVGNALDDTMDIVSLEAIVAMDGSCVDLHQWASGPNAFRLSTRLRARDAPAAIRRAVQRQIRLVLAARRALKP